MNIKKLGIIGSCFLLLIVLVYLQINRLEKTSIAQKNEAEFNLNNTEKKLTQINTEKNIGNKNIQIYNADNMPYENLKYIKEKTYKKILEINNNIEFMGDFKEEDLSKKSYYRKKYFKILKEEESYINRLEEKGYYDFFVYDPQKVDEYTYYFFDMNGDEAPELLVRIDENIYIFTYIEKTKTIELVDIENAGNTYFLGSNKLGAWYGGTGLTYEFYELDKNWEIDSKILFHSEGFLNKKSMLEDEIYLVGFRLGSNEEEYIKHIANNMDEQLYEKDVAYFLRISKEQYNQLTQDYFKSREIAEEKIQNVKYTFEELFGDL